MNLLYSNVDCTNSLTIQFSLIQSVFLRIDEKKILFESGRFFQKQVGIFFCLIAFIDSFPFSRWLFFALAVALQQKNCFRVGKVAPDSCIGLGDFFRIFSSAEFLNFVHAEIHFFKV